MSAEDVANGLMEKASATLSAAADLGALEKALQQARLEPCRQAVERLVQEKAEAQARLCPKGRRPLNRAW
jgi:hypothetical protein